MSRRNLFWLLGIAAVSLFGYAVGLAAPSREKDKDYENVRLVVDVLHEVDTKYVRELDADAKRKLVEDMINGGLERLDPHSQYINAKDYKQFEKASKGKFGGIGIQVGFDRANRGQLTVISPMPGTPAEKAGLRPDDAIVKIDGKSTDGMRINDAVDLIQGDPGQKITLSVVHAGGKDIVDVPIERAIIKVDSVMGDRRDKTGQWDYMLEGTDKIGYIRLTNFSETATDELKAAIMKVKAQGARALVLDLRGNPGGLLKAAVEISNFFIKDGRIVSTKGRNHKDEVYDAKPTNTLDLPDPFPIAILINRNSASASEIVSAALQDNDRAVIVGERSYGKGSVQHVIMMGKDEKEQSALKLTTASYWRPSGKNIHRFPDSKESDEWGVKPSSGLEVPLKDEERFDWLLWRSNRDVWDPEDPDGKNKPKDKKDFKDRVLEKAVEQLRKELEKGKAAMAEPQRGAA
jgi:carboxyl-terminal processing protease